MFNKILVVCVGNICRSPTGERLLQAVLPNKYIASAGIGVSKSGLDGKSADKQAQMIAELNNVSLEGHQSQQLTVSMCLEFDLILVMEKGHIDAVCHLAPEVRGKVMLFGQWIGAKDIPDPYRKSPEAFEFAFELLLQSTQAWASKL